MLIKMYRNFLDQNKSRSNEEERTGLAKRRKEGTVANTTNLPTRPKKKAKSILQLNSKKNKRNRKKMKKMKNWYIADKTNSIKNVLECGYKMAKPLCCSIPSYQLSLGIHTKLCKNYMLNQARYYARSNRNNFALFSVCSLVSQSLI